MFADPLERLGHRGVTENRAGPIVEVDEGHTE
jgi:hypothetical protein